MITRLNSFLNEGRSIVLPQDVKAMIQSQYSTSKPCVFRGVDDERKELLVDPTKWHRRSKENSNHYTLWIDNNDSWAGYPLRSKSIICATSDRIARNFSTYVFDVWPLDQDAVFGMCPASDIWNSINIKFNTDGDIDDVRAVLVGTKYTQIAELPEVPEAVRKFVWGRLQHVPHTYMELNDYTNMLSLLSVDDKNYDIMEADLKALGIYEFTDAVIRPVGFRTITFKELMSGDWGLREIWTEAECALLINDEYSNLNDDAE